MHLQHLEISGFKSFPDRSKLKFDDGMTAIVGPNGCGKSNVVDAITWVLGEQSAKSLRGDRMQDVIFSGSDGRKPIGAAEVKLLLRGVTVSSIGRSNGHSQSNGKNGHDKSDENRNSKGHGNVTKVVLDEVESIPGAKADLGVSAPIVARDVEVSRRLYRSGESEYLIDGKVCRLRDVQDLLMDSGVGVKAYAVIEQGKIGQILSARPNDRRQLIEEAAGVTKYKTRRHASELKLEAAKQNLDRVDDIVHEVDKQRNALKRQAAKARRYRRLREELRRWEKVLFARRHRALALTVATANANLADASTREQAASAHLAELENRQERQRIELTESETQATSTRDSTHTRELKIDRSQQQLKFNRQQVDELNVSSKNLRDRLTTLEAQRVPANERLERQRADVTKAEAACREAEQQITTDEAAYAATRLEIQSSEASVESVRNEVFSLAAAATALRHEAEQAVEARERVVEDLGKLDVEQVDLAAERDKLTVNSQLASDGRAEAQQAVDQVGAAQAEGREELDSIQRDLQTVTEELRSDERELAALTATLKSLEEVEAARAGYADAARLILTESNGEISHMGSVADYLEVDDKYELAVEACLGELLQYVVVARCEHAVAGLRFVREKDAGRCGFLVIAGDDNGGAKAHVAETSESLPPGLLPLMSVVRVSGSCAPAVRSALGHAYLAESLEQALEAATVVTGSIAALSGEVVRGVHFVSSGAKSSAKGILTTRREIKVLRHTIVEKQTSVETTGRRLDDLKEAVTAAVGVLAKLDEERQTHEKTALELNLRLVALDEESKRVVRHDELLAAERRRAEEEQTAVENRQREARESLVTLEGEKQEAEKLLSVAQEKLSRARTSFDTMGQIFGDNKALHARLGERALAEKSAVNRLLEETAELESRVVSSRDDLSRKNSRKQLLQAQIIESERSLDNGVQELENLRGKVRTTDDLLVELRSRVEVEDVTIRSARAALEEVRDRLGQFEVSQATAQADLSHLATSCLETLQVDLDSVISEVEQLEADGEVMPDEGFAQLPPDGAVAEVGEDDSEHEVGGDSTETTDSSVPVTTEDVITGLKGKIDRLGAVNMMAIDQFDELDNRYDFLTTQRKDLVDSIAATTEAIRRINKTTRERFRTAFDAINMHYQQTFSTLFGGGKAGLVLLDEADLLESGVEIIAQPPGKRLQSVQLLSGGEKALSAMALMFAIFKYRPSPFCLLDEIDAPLDDVNIGRFIEMLRGMVDETQFVLITHNRKTMEHADRLYGITMEEPGVSKLISVQFN